MNRIVREHYPAAKLPKDLREGLGADAKVRVTVEPDFKTPERALTLDELFAMRRPPFRSTEEIVEDLRRHREEWDD